jgi:Zn-dependent metalloprotease
VRLALFINAHTGEVVRREDLVARVDITIPASGHGHGVLGDRWELALSQRGTTFSLQDPTRGKFRTTAVRSGEKLPGRTVTSKDAEVWEGAGQAIDVHAHLQALWDYFATQHQRFGWDGKGTGIVAVTHLGTQAPLALFDGERLLFGDGDGTTLLPSGAALDLVAHEYGHALARSTADLGGDGESRALDEGLADLWGCLIEQAVEPRRGNWTLGEQLFLANQPHGGKKMPPLVLRDLADPLHTGQASSLTGYVAVPEDLPGLPGMRSLLVRDAQHKNAGIAAHAGYLLAQRLGLASTAAIVYRALTTYLHRYAGFADAADAMAAAARDLYGEGAQAAAVTASWSAVGVSGLSP